MEFSSKGFQKSNMACLFFMEKQMVPYLLFSLTTCFLRCLCFEIVIEYDFQIIYLKAYIGHTTEISLCSGRFPPPLNSISMIVYITFKANVKLTQEIAK